MKVFVTGATGLLGRAVIDELHKQGHETRSLIHATAISRNDPFSETDIVWGDLSRENEHADYVKGCDAIVHCAWNFVRGDDMDAYTKVNIEPAAALMRTAYQQGISRFITISSVSVYGLDRAFDGEPFSEESAFCSYDDAMDVYPRAKQECEKVLTKVGEELSMPVTIIRPGLLYSDATPPVKKFIKGKVLLLAGFGANHLPYIHVDSVAELIGDVLATPANKDSVEIINAVPPHHDTARAVLKRWKIKNNSTAKTIYLPIPMFRLLALAPFLIKKVLKKNAKRPNVEYQTKTGTRNVDYSAQYAEDKYGWIGY
jgi:nucleoside-diphosphate-sugar epimerase